MTSKKFLMVILVSSFCIKAITFAVSQPKEPPYIPVQVLWSDIDRDTRSNSEKTLERLRDLSGLIVTVDVSMILPVKESSLGKQMDSIREETAKVLTEMLGVSGVPAVSFSDWKESRFKPVLKLFISFSDTSFIMWLYCEDQFVLQRNSGSYKYMDIWQSRGMFSCPTILKDDTAESRKVIIESSRKLMDNFIQKYHKANPTRARVSKPDSPSAEEQNMISQFIQGKSSDNELKDLSRFFPAIDFRGTESGYLRGPTPKQMVIIEKIVNKYALALKKNDIPQTDLSTWTKDPIKTHMKYSLIISEDFAMFTLALFDRYVLKRNPEEFEYWSIWAHNQSFEGEEVSRAKAVNFFMAQNTMALKEFVRDYKAANPSKVNQ